VYELFSNYVVITIKNGEWAKWIEWFWCANYTQKLLCIWLKYEFTHRKAELTEDAWLQKCSVDRQKEVMFSVRSVCLSVQQITRKLVNGFWWNFFGGVWHVSRTKWYNFGGDLDHPDRRRFVLCECILVFIFFSPSVVLLFYSLLSSCWNLLRYTGSFLCSSPKLGTLKNFPRHIPQSPSSITWYLSHGRECSADGKVTVGQVCADRVSQT